jgi:hypothetical protein
MYKDSTHWNMTQHWKLIHIKPVTSEMVLWTSYQWVFIIGLKSVLFSCFMILILSPLLCPVPKGGVIYRYQSIFHQLFPVIIWWESKLLYQSKSIKTILNSTHWNMTQHWKLIHIKPVTSEMVLWTSYQWVNQ